GRSTGRHDTAAPHFVEWQFDPAHPSTNFNGVTVTLRKAGDADSGLETGIYKFGLDYGARLACDGVFAKDGSAGGQMEMVISGLPPGPHSIATYHNSILPPEKPLARFNLYVNGLLALTNLQPTIQATNDYDVASAY